MERLGPGFITGASDDDPSGIGTYSQTGAQFGYSQLWLAFFSIPFMVAVQEMCGRIGLVTGEGLSSVMRRKFPLPILYAAVLLLFLANTINIGADLGAMAASAQLLLPVPFTLLLLGMTSVTLFLEIMIPYKIYAGYLKYLTLSLFSYIIVAFFVNQPWDVVVMSTLVPSFSFGKEYLMNIVAFLGTTISPYLFFWQTSEEVEEKLSHKKLSILPWGWGLKSVHKSDLTRMRIDTVIGMVFSNIVAFFIMVTAASTLGFAGITEIESAAQAAEALRPLAGDFAFLLFTVGVIGTGLLAVPVLAGASSYAIAELFHWHEGLSLTFRQAKGFYVIIILSTVGGVLVNFIGIPPFRMLYYTAIFNGIAAPILLVMILLIANDRKIMGNYVNSKWSNIFGGIITVLMGVAAIALLALL